MDTKSQITEQEHQQFIMASLNERDKINQFKKLNPDFDLKKVTNVSGYSTFDAYAVSGESLYNWAVEVKIRSFGIKKYSTAYIKCYKWYQMISKCDTPEYKEKNVQPYYMMFYTDGSVALWNLYHAPADFIIKEYTLYNVINSPVVKNKLFELKLSDATIYKWK